MHSPIIAEEDAGPALSRRLAPRERQLVMIVWRAGEASATDIQNALPEPVSNAAIRSMLGRLEGKGVLVRYRQGRKYLYAPAAVDRTGEAALRKLSRDHFSGSMTRAAAAMASLIVSDAAGAQR
jgi:predicted transcriptional regulator